MAEEKSPRMGLTSVLSAIEAFTPGREEEAPGEQANALPGSASTAASSKDR
jgi:hypothetical protein